MINRLTKRAWAAVALGTAAGAAAIIAACSGDSNDAATPNGDNTTVGVDGATGTPDGGGTTAPGSDTGTMSVSPIPIDAGGVSTQPSSCANPTISIVFSPMYSAFISGSTQAFSVPAVTADGKPATWSLSDPAQGNLQLAGFPTGGDVIPGVLITIAGTGDSNGQVTVVATEDDGSCGISVLNITTCTEQDWEIGRARYNNGTKLEFHPPDGGFMLPDGYMLPDGFTFPDGGFDGNFAGFEGGFDVYVPSADAPSLAEVDGGTACTNCHGPTATDGLFKTVAHTPEQTAGFSNDDLKNIIRSGQVPEGGYFDPKVIIASCEGGPTCATQAQTIWRSFHRWSDITDDMLPGVICYLRSLAPQSQTGASNFGGFFRRDAGTPPPSQ